MKWQDFCEDEIEIPNNIVKFMEEYEKLCKKHSLMILSEGEPVVIAEADEKLWNIKASTAGDIRRQQEWERRKR